MRFTLTYKGRLPANGSSSDKHEVRKALHPQLRQLFNYPPLARRKDEMLTEHEPRGRSIIKSLGGYRFAPVINTMYRQVALLELLFLRPQEPGKLIVSGGDIDNRLKTLFDALRMPQVSAEIPKTAQQPERDEDPFFCLLEDDALITEIDVKTDVLLDPAAQPSDVQLFIRVRTEAIDPNIMSVGL